MGHILVLTPIASSACSYFYESVCRNTFVIFYSIIFVFHMQYKNAYAMPIALLLPYALPLQIPKSTAKINLYCLLESVFGI